MPQIHSFGEMGQGSPMGNILAALKTAHEYYGIQSAKNAQDQLSQQQDPNSDYTKARQADATAAVGYLAKKGYIPQDAASPLLESIGKLSGSQIDTMNKESPMLQIGLHQMAADAAAQKMAGLVGIKQQQFAESQNQHSVDAGKAFDNDPIIKASQISKNSLDRSTSILNNPNKPVTAKDMNLAYNDYINAVTAGGAATEGKIQRELPETWAQMFNDMKAKSGEFDDMRKSPTGQKLISMLSENINTVNKDLKNAAADRAVNLFSNYQSSSNEKAKDIAKQKLKTYAPDQYGALFEGKQLGGSPAPQGGGIPGVSSAQASDDPMVSVVSPEGKTGKIPRSKLSTALQRGFKTQ